MSNERKKIYKIINTLNYDNAWHYQKNSKFLLNILKIIHSSLLLVKINKPVTLKNRNFNYLKIKHTKTNKYQK